MLKQFITLYRRLIICLFLSVLTACTTLPPNQQISDAKQAITAAKVVIEKNSPTDNNAELAANQSSYQLAKEALSQAEKALLEQRYPAAITWSANSKRHAQDILKRYHKKNTNVRFRHE